MLGTEVVFNKLYFYVYLNAIQVDPLMKDVLSSDYKISLMKNPATYKTKIINENSLSLKLCTCQPFSFSPPVDAEACLTVLVCASPVQCLEEKPRCSDAPVTETLVHICTQGSQGGRENVSSSSNSSGTSSIPLPEVRW